MRAWVGQGHVQLPQPRCDLAPGPAAPWATPLWRDRGCLGWARPSVCWALIYSPSFSTAQCRHVIKPYSASKQFCLSVKPEWGICQGALSTIFRPCPRLGSMGLVMCIILLQILVYQLLIAINTKSQNYVLMRMSVRNVVLVGGWGPRMVSWSGGPRWTKVGPTVSR